MNSTVLTLVLNKAGNGIFPLHQHSDVKSWKCFVRILMLHPNWLNLTRTLKTGDLAEYTEVSVSLINDLKPYLSKQYAALGIVF